MTETHPFVRPLRRKPYHPPPSLPRVPPAHAAGDAGAAGDYDYFGAEAGARTGDISVFDTDSDSDGGGSELSAPLDARARGERGVVPLRPRPSPAPPPPPPAARAGEVSAAAFAAGEDAQRIPWARLNVSRADYRASRLRDIGSAGEVARGARTGFYDFVRNTRRVTSSIWHFQLRNLVWAVSRSDVVLMMDGQVVAWDAVEGRVSMVADEGVQVSSMAAGPLGGVVVVGGFFGEVLILRDGVVKVNRRITYDENAITNAIDLFEDRLMASNNDCYVRVFDVDTFTKIGEFRFATPVNHATRQPEGKMVAVVGDDNPVIVMDGDTGERIARLHGHTDYSFATAWHPDGTLFATGGQDNTARVWDVRKMDKSIAVLTAHMGAVRSLRFSGCGRFLALAEAKDFVHIYSHDFSVSQEIDLFGEVAGISFSPEADALFVGIMDPTYGSLLEYERTKPSEPFMPIGLL